MSNDFPINEDYMEYIILHIVKANLVEDVKIIKTWGDDIGMIDIFKMQITPNKDIKRSSINIKLIYELMEIQWDDKKRK